MVPLAGVDDELDMGMRERSVWRTTPRVSMWVAIRSLAPELLSQGGWHGSRLLGQISSISKRGGVGEAPRGVSH